MELQDPPVQPIPEITSNFIHTTCNSTVFILIFTKNLKIKHWNFIHKPIKFGSYIKFKTVTLQILKIQNFAFADRPPIRSPPVVVKTVVEIPENSDSHRGKNRKISSFAFTLIFIFQLTNTI